jgi:release factor glutamine methyltransferase
MEAVSLLMHTLKVDRAFVIAHPDRELSPAEGQRFREVVSRRASREPLQYITGSQEFFNLTFEVTPDVLIPRPETELIVETALDLLRPIDAPFIADVGTGSGCIAISILHQMPSARAVAIDISPRALAVARRNGQRHGVMPRFGLAQANELSAFLKQPIFSAIVSNPPYIRAKDIDGLQPEVRHHEPLSALVAGDDGLSHIRALVRDAAHFLQTNGYLIFEIGFDQSDSVRALVDSTNWDLVEIKNDLQNIPRVFVLRKK